MYELNEVQFLANESVSIRFDLKHCYLENSDNWERHNCRKDIFLISIEMFSITPFSNYSLKDPSVS